MSNLKLPTMTFEALRKVTPDNGLTKTIAYATTASFFEDGADSYILIQHHYHNIGKIYADGRVWIHNAGYSSNTTATRLREILSDNHIPFKYAIRQGSAVIFPNGLDTKAERTPLMWPGAIFTKGSERYTAQVGDGTSYQTF